MDISEILATGGSGAVSFAVIITLLRMLEKRLDEKKAEKNGGTLYTRLSLVEAQITSMGQTMGKEIEELQTKLGAVHRDLCVFREDMRLHFARIQAREEGRKEVMREARKDG